MTARKGSYGKEVEEGRVGNWGKEKKITDGIIHITQKGADELVGLPLCSVCGERHYSNERLCDD